MASDLHGDALSLVCKGCDKSFDSKTTVPLLMPCLHSFCKQCLEKSMKKEEVAENKMACPTCNGRFPQPKNIDLLPVNRRLSHLAKTASVEKLAKSGNVKCQKCEGNSPKDATTYLYNHSEFLCDQCTKCYKRFNHNNELVFMELSACEKGDFKTHQPPSKCQEHNENYVMYCVDCKSLICMVCGQTDHFDHKKKAIKDIATSEKKALEELTNGVDDALQTIDEALHGIEEMRGKVKVSAKEANKRIDEACDQLIQAVENRRKVLKERCQEIAEGKDDVLSNQMVRIERLKRNLAVAQVCAKDTIGNQHPEEVLGIKKHIEDRLIRVKELYDRESMELSEDDVINTSLDTPALIDNIKSFGSFPNVPDHRNCTSDDPLLTNTLVGKPKIMNVTLKDELKAMVTSKCHFQYQLTKVGEDPDEYIPPKVTITQGNNNGTATLEFTPDQPGEYELTIMVRNKPIADPYKITAIEGRDYKLFQNEPVTAYKNVGGNCVSVAVHDNGTVYATNNGGHATNNGGHTIKVLKPDGEESNIGDNSAAGGNLYSPRGIALIGDTIYVVSRSNHSIKMYSTDGRFIKSLGTGAGAGDDQFNGPYGICTDGHDRVCVADYNNKRIQVLSSDGTFIKCIQCSHQPYDVAIDPDGNIHAALYNNHHIAVYSPQDGRQIETYNLGENLRYPAGIYIDSKGNRLIACGSNNMVYIGDSCGSDNGMVYIGDSKDTLLASKKINTAYGITMNDGLIYVAECGNKRVSVY